MSIIEKKLITDHKVNGLNEALNIIPVGEPGSGNAHTEYMITFTRRFKEGFQSIISANLQFQNGPIATPDDVNGISNEALIAVVIDRMRGFQSGPFACPENALALTKLEEAMMWLHKRTRDRMARGVEGKLEP